jgi:mycothiol synthase
MNQDQVQMLWPEHRQVSPSQYQPPKGYHLRTFHPSDSPNYFRLMEQVGWPGWDDAKLRPWLYRILPDGWFMLVEEKTSDIVATCMATHDPTWQVPFCGEVGWTAAHPAHRGKGLGTVVVGAVMARFIEAGYTRIHLYTEEWRYAALKMYLKLGFVPYLDPPQSIDQWQRICSELDWPFTPDKWVDSLE